MNFAIRVGNSFGTPLNLHSSWLWILPLMAVNLVWYDVSEWLGAIATSLSIFGSVLFAALAQLWVVRKIGLQWQRMTLFLFGGVVERAIPSKPRQEMHVAGASTVAYLLLCLVFIVPSVVLPIESIRLELLIVALFNAGMMLFSLLFRLSPFHDNLLHAILARFFDHPVPHYSMIVSNSFALSVFIVAGAIMPSIGWIAFACWAALGVMLLQLASTAVLYGKYQENLEKRPTTDFANTTYHDWSLPHTSLTELKKAENDK